jgi:hypothetical protein
VTWEPERLEPMECELPPRASQHNNGKKLFDVDAVKDWLWENPGEWCRVLGADQRGFNLREVNTLRGSLYAVWRGEDGHYWCEIQTRRRPDGLADVYVRTRSANPVGQVAQP